MADPAPQHIAFYAPLKSPDHKTPSGDRQIARNLIDTLRGIGPGWQVSLVSTLRSRDGQGSAAVQDQINRVAEAEIDRLIGHPHANTWTAWVTYHNYYKAPDLIGPAVTRALGIPYVLIEATRAQKRLNGPWAQFARAAEAACDVADAIFYFTERDAQALVARQVGGQEISHLRPFLNIDKLPPAPRRKKRGNTLLAVGMMREGDKLASYQTLATALAEVSAPKWSLDIIGDGPAKAEVEVAFEPFGSQVRLQGEQPPEAVAWAMSRADALVWPGVNEAFGMVYLEAQAQGLPIVAEDRPGLREVIAAPDSLLPEGAARAFGGRIDHLLSNADDRQREGRQARAYIRKHHLRRQAAKTLATTLTRLTARGSR